jgi:hypothetical protein
MVKFFVAGILDFIPLMRYSYDWVPARPFALIGYVMFAYLFSWTDTHWYVAFHLLSWRELEQIRAWVDVNRLKRRKTKVFRFTPTPVR